MDNPLIHIVLRGSQIAFAAIVFGLSVHLVREQIRGSAPISLGYASFVGAASLVGAFIGMAGNFIDSLQGVIGLAIDGFLVLANLAGGVLLAVQLQGMNCSNVLDEDNLDVKENDVLLAGCGVKHIRGEECSLKFLGDANKFISFVEARCKTSTADSAFMFLTLIVVLVASTLLLLARRRR